MRIWLITVGEPLPLGGSEARLWRTGLLARELAARGHDVLWWTSRVDHFRKCFHEPVAARVVAERGIEIHFLEGRLYRRNVSLARFVNHLQIGRDFRRCSAREGAVPDVILCSLPTLELCDEAVAYGRARGIPVLLDVRDLWPDEMLARVPAALRPLGRLALAPLERAARRALRGATGVVAISRSYLRWAEQRRGRAAGPDDLVVPIGYPTPATHFAAPDVSDRMRAKGVDPARKIAWFCGTFVGSIDLGTAIEAARLAQRETDLQFVLSGDGERRAEWEAQARGLANVVFTGWCDRAELAWLSRRAWVGLAAYKPRALMSLPNKLFEYMSAGLPIVSSLGGEAAELIAQRELGRSFEAGNAGELARVLRELAARPTETARYAANARAVFASEFAAERLYARLADHLEAHARAALARAPSNAAVTPAVAPAQ
jgi:glycosyltransferase involved in cell wall biosynthesis